MQQRIDNNKDFDILIFRQIKNKRIIKSSRFISARYVARNVRFRPLPPSPFPPLSAIEGDNSFEKLRFEPIHERVYSIFNSGEEEAARAKGYTERRKKDLRVLEHLISGSLRVVKDASVEAK